MRSNQIKGVAIRELEISQNPETFEPLAQFQINCAPTPAQARQLKDGAKITLYIAAKGEVKKGPGRPPGSKNKATKQGTEGTEKPPETPDPPKDTKKPAKSHYLEGDTEMTEAEKEEARKGL